MGHAGDVSSPPKKRQVQPAPPLSRTLCPGCTSLPLAVDQKGIQSLVVCGSSPERRWVSAGQGDLQPGSLVSLSALSTILVAPSPASTCSYSFLMGRHLGIQNGPVNVGSQQSQAGRDLTRLLASLSLSSLSSVSFPCFREKAGPERKAAVLRHSWAW